MPKAQQPQAPHIPQSSFVWPETASAQDKKTAASSDEQEL